MEKQEAIDVLIAARQTLEKASQLLATTCTPDMLKIVQNCIDEVVFALSEIDLNE